MSEATTTAAAATATTTAAATTTDNTTTDTTTTAAAPWHGITDAEAAKYVDNKGWKSPADVIKSYQGAEKLIGRDPSTLLVLPRADDPEGYKQVFTKLGKPEKPEAYEVRAGLPKEAKVDEAFATAMQGFFHEADLTAGQAKTLAAKYNAHVLAQAEQAAKDYELNVQADKQALLEKWKGGHDRMMNRAKTAAQSLGFSPELIDAIERQVGYAKTYEMLADIGGKLGEDNFVSGNKDKPGFESQLTPAEAKAAWDQFKMDPNNVKALQDPSHPGHKAAQARQTALFKIMYPEN